MRREPVESSVFVSIGYDEYLKILEVEFKSGRVREYLDVEPRKAADFLSAPSLGKFWHIKIRGLYYSARVQPS